MITFCSVSGQRMASGLRRAILYVGVCLLLVWLFGAFFFTSSTVSIAYGDDGDGTRHVSV